MVDISFPDGTPRCQVRTSGGSQCSRIATVKGVWCKQHSPDAKAERDRKAAEKYETARVISKRMFEVRVKRSKPYNLLRDALIQIAADSEPGSHAETTARNALKAVDK